MKTVSADARGTNREKNTATKIVFVIVMGPPPPFFSSEIVWHYPLAIKPAVSMIPTASHSLRVNDREFDFRQQE
jgi:hypothetical protein